MDALRSGTFVTTDEANSYGTDPTDPDTDDDGYWDGWIGVHGVGQTDNVVLYQEHLRDDDDGNGLTVSEGDDDGGVKGDEIVTQQAGYHKVTEASSAMGEDIDGDGTDEHANIHIGELHWKENDPSQPGNPKEPGITPSPSLDVEVDHYESISRNDIDWLGTVSDTYALNGINVEFVLDDNISEADLTCPYITCIDQDTPPTSLDDARSIENEFHDDTAKTYFFISPDGDDNPGSIPDFAPDPEGVASNQGSDTSGFGFGVLVFMNDHTEGPQRLHLAKTTTHEVGHLIGIGRADDGKTVHILPKEVYSGSSDDETPEEVGYAGRNSDLWSTMSSGWNDPVTNKPMSGRYITFSIEELTTIELNNLQTVD